MNSMVGAIYLALSAYGRKQTFQLVSNNLSTDIRMIIGPWNARVTDATGALECLREWLTDGKATGEEANFAFSFEFFLFMPPITGGCDNLETVLERFIDEGPLQTPYVGAKNIQASMVTKLPDGIRFVSLPGGYHGIAHTNRIYHITHHPEEWLHDISRKHDPKPRVFTTRKKTKGGAVKTYTYTTIGAQPTSDYFKARQKYTPHPRKPLVDERQRKLILELHSMGNKSQRDVARAVDVSLYAVRKVLKEEKASSRQKQANEPTAEQEYASGSE